MARPILFSGPMVRAILDGRKTQTRRVLKPQPETGKISRPFHPEHRSGRRWVFMARDDFPSYSFATCDFKVPYASGDQLWVKEGWRDEHPLAIQDGRYSQPGRAGIPGPPPVNYRTIYRTDGEPLHIWRNGLEHPYFTTAGPVDDIAAQHPTVCSNFDRADGKGVYWENARFMPRWASRLTLTVTDVRVQKLHEITCEDAEAEGIWYASQEYREQVCIWRDAPAVIRRLRVTHFAKLWDSLNAGRGFGWDANPWVVALTFAVERRNIDGVPE